MQLPDIKQRKPGADILTKFENLLEKDVLVLKTKFSNVIKVKQKYLLISKTKN